MVYNFLKKLPYQLQKQCLLCQCAIVNNTDIYGLCSYCLNAQPAMQPCCLQCGSMTAKPMQQCGECAKKPPHFAQTIAFTRFNPDIQRLIYPLKQQHDLAVLRLLSDCLVATVLQQTLNVDVIIPVPMHWRRKLLQGNNHGALLAKQVAKKLSITYNDHWLKKQWHTQPQRGQSGQKRRLNLLGAFYCQQNLSGHRIAIVDDVMTTGSTMNEVAKALKKAGAAEVIALVVAKT